jgi:hypothetical protein
LTNTVTNIQRNRPIDIARALARWNCTDIKVAFISPKNQSWNYMNSINKFSNICSARYICYDQTYDLTIGKNDREIEKILSQCSIVHCDDEIPEELIKKITVPIVYGNWSSSSYRECEEIYKEAINEPDQALRKQQSQPTSKPTHTTSRKKTAVPSSRTTNNIRLL